MKFTPHTLLSSASLFILLSASCAQVQTHKNIRTAGQYYEGFELSKPHNIYLSKGKWYIKADKIKLKQRYPLVNDPIFLEIGAPYIEKEGEKLTVNYHPISKDTVTILRRNDGFYKLSMLADDVQKNSKHRMANIDPKKTYPILAKIDGDSSYLRVYNDNKKQEINLTYLSLSYLDKLFIDIPASIIYNISIPFVSPFYFFSNLAEDNKKNPLN